jgi:hypothetical protein
MSLLQLPWRRQSELFMLLEARSYWERAHQVLLARLLTAAGKIIHNAGVPGLVHLLKMKGATGATEGTGGTGGQQRHRANSPKGSPAAVAEGAMAKKRKLLEPTQVSREIC